MEKKIMNQMPQSFPRLDGNFVHGNGPCSNSQNKKTLNELLSEVYSDPDSFESNPDLFGGGNDVVVSERERYGLPEKTVLNLESGLIRTDPYYTDAVVERFYSKFYRPIYNSSFGKEAISNEELLAAQAVRGRGVRDILDAYVKPRSRILDYGCGAGGMLIPFRDLGCEVLGVDYGPDLVDFGKSQGINLLNGGFDVIPEGNRYDVIIVSHVLEHIKRPFDFLSRIRSLLSDEGVAYIEVPSLKWIQNCWKNDTLLHLQSAHVWYFSSQTMRRLAQQAGFSILSEHGEVGLVLKKGPVVELSVAPNYGSRVLDYLKMNEKILKYIPLGRRLPSRLILRRYSNI